MRRALALFLLMLSAACAPVVMPAGPLVRAPILGENAVVAGDGAVLPLRRFAPEGPPRAVLLALHGFNDHSGNFLTDSLEALKQGGLLVYAYDQRGFGRAPNRGYWAGAQTLASDAAAAARLLRARHPDLPFYLLGESMGASVAIVASAADPPPPVDGYVLLTPALYARGAMNAMLRGGLWLVAHTIPVLPFQGGVGSIVASDNPAALRRLGRDPLVIRQTRVDSAVGLVYLMDAAVAALPQCCRGAQGQPVPTLVLVGARDRVVPQHASRAALHRLPPGRVRLGVYPEGYHLLLADRNREAVALDVLGFLTDPAAPLPSDAEGHVEDWLAGRPLRTGS